MSSKNKQKALEWNEAHLMREMTNDDPHKKDFRGLGKHRGKTGGAFGKRHLPNASVSYDSERH